MSGPNFVTAPEADDIIIIAGMSNPGIAKVKVSKKHEWDKKKGKGSTGGTVTYTGSQLCDFEVDFYLWLPEHFDAWPTFAAALATSTPVATSATVPAAQAPQQTGNVRQATTSTTPTTVTTTSPQPTALDVYHPSLAEPPFNITRCIVLEPGGKEPDGKGGATYKYKFSEYAPPKPSGGTANGSKDGTGSGGGSAPQKFVELPAKDAADQEIDRLMKKAQGL